MEKILKILCINPGSTSTKVALFSGAEKLDETNIEHSAQELSAYPDILSQLPMRKRAIDNYLSAHGVSARGIGAIAVRGGPVGRRYHAGAYAVDEAMYNVCLDPKNSGHAMCLAPIIAYQWVRDYGIPAYNYDVVMVDELKDVARLTALPDVERTGNCHVLNTKAVARQVAEENGATYDTVNYIVSHLGGGCSTSLHEHGRITDVVSSGEGTFTPSRTGRLPHRALMKLCFSGKYDEKSLNKLLSGECGLVAHLGTSDCREAERMIEAGDRHAKAVYEAFAYNIAKDIASLSAAVSGRVDGIILTGGIAHSKMLTEMIRARVEFLAPVTVFPGAIEMEALAAGILRVMSGEEKAHRFGEKF